MATHDYVIANGTGAAVRSDLNDALAAIVSNNSGSSEPGTTYAYQWWADTNANVLKIRNSANNAWITLRELDGTMLIEDGSASTPGLAFADDVNTGIFSPAADQIGFATGGAERLEIGSSEVVFNDPSNDVDFRVESNGQTHMLFVDGGNDRVGIGTSSPSRPLSVSSGQISARFTSTSADSQIEVVDTSGTVVFGSSSGNAIVQTGGSERARIDSSGRLLIGTSTSKSAGSGQYSPLNVQGYIGDATGGGELCLSRGEAATSIAADEQLGAVLFTDSAGQAFGSITCKADAAAGSGDYPGRIEFSTTADGASSRTERLRIDASGQVILGHGISSGNSSTLRITGGTNGASYLEMGDADDTDIGQIAYYQSSNAMGFRVNASEAMRIDSSANLGVGISSPASRVHVKGGSLTVEHGSPSTGTGQLNINSEANSQATFSYDDEGTIVVGTATTPATQAGFSEKLRITSGGTLLIGQTNESFGTIGHVLKGTGQSFHVVSDDTALFINRKNSDGELVRFAQDDGTEGSITVSGSTVSYNGGHLTRWSQLAAGAARTEILRGSVLSNLDEMCEWAHAAQDAVLYTEEDELPEGVSVGDVKTPAVDAYTEDNEQLNRMKVSDVEGDVNVAGVFQAWDDDDDTYTNDFYCAMTGDFVIRIAQGTTVARGDLLMSAGDGTAKPQDDDIVRSKTIAKVTSTTVSTTYSDGSYCIPCVLMAC